MGVQERLSLEAVNENTLIACEHVHRYELAAPLCHGLRAIDLACGVGYGSVILSDEATQVLGVDRDTATMEAATLGAAGRANVRFEAADAADYLRADLEEHDVIVCFEGLEHFDDLDSVLANLKRHANAGKKLIVSVPNSLAFDETNEFHATDFGFEGASEAFEGFGEFELLYQYSAEGSLIRTARATGLAGEFLLEENGEPEYANHYIACVNLKAELAERSDSARMQLAVAPLHSRYARNLERANNELWRENARLGRGRLGVGDSAAGAALAKVDDMRQQKEQVEEHVRQLDLVVADLRHRLLILDTPRHRLVEKVRERLLGHPVLHGATRALWALIRP